MYDPAAVVEASWKYLPSYAGPDNGGVVGKKNSSLPNASIDVLLSLISFLM